MEGVRHPKLELHDAVQQAAHDPQFAGKVAGGLVTRWVLVTELMLPGNELALVTTTSTASGEDLTSWDSSGLLAKAMVGELTER